MPATPEEIAIKADVSNLVANLAKAARSFDTMGASVEVNETAVKKANKAYGEVISTIKQVGDVVTKTETIFLDAEKGLQKFTRVSKLNVKQTKAQRQAQAQLNRTLKAGQQIRKELIQRRTRLGGVGFGTREEQTNLLEAQNALLKFQKANDITRGKVTQLFKEFKSGNLTATEGLDGLRLVVLRLLKAEEALGASARKTAEIQKNTADVAAAALKKQNAELTRQQVLEAELNQTRGFLQRRVVNAGGRASGSRSELNKIDAAQASFQKFQKTQQLTNNQAQQLFTNFEAGLIPVTQATDELRRRLEAVTQAERQLGTAAREASDKAIAGIQAEIAARQKARAELLKQQQFEIGVQSTRGFLRDRQRPSILGATGEKEEAGIRKANAALQQLQRTAGFTDAQIQKTFGSIQRGTFVSTEATDKLEARIRAVIAAEDAVGIAAKKAFDIQVAAIKKTNDLQAEKNRKLAEEAALQKILAGTRARIDTLPRTTFASQATLGETERVNKARQALLKFQEVTGTTDVAVNRMFNDFQNGTVKSSQLTDALRSKVVAVLQAVQAEGAAAKKAFDIQAAATLKVTQATDKANQALREQLRLQQQAASVRGITRAGGRGARVEAGLTTESGGTGERAAQSFLVAERNLEKLALTGKLTDITLQKAFIDARSGALKFATATTQAEREVLKLLASAKQLGPTGLAGASAIGKIAGSIADLGRLVGISLVIGAAFRLVQAFEDAAAASIELSVSLAEIDTIQTENALSTDEWSESLIELSNAFGIDKLQQAEAAYQTLSNQVAQGAEAIRFLDAANRLAVTGVTDTAAAVNLLTSTINAFNLPVEDAELISAKFFKTVELGRVRIEEMSDSFGRIALPASQLGVSLEELQAALAITTIQGVKFNEASTFIRNILLKLLRPTDALKQLFSDLGVSSGEAAIKTFGFGGFLRILEERTKGSSTELGELFGRIRAITGAMAFAGENVERFEKTLKKIEETNVQDFLQDTNKVLESTGQQLRIAREQAANLFERELGKPATEALAAFIKRMDGAENIIRKTANAFILLTKVITAGALIQGLANLGVAFDALKIRVLALNAALALNPFNIVATAIAAAIVFTSEVAKNAAADSLREAEASSIELLRLREDFNRNVKNLIGEETRNFERGLTIQTRSLQQEIAVRNAVLRRQNDEITTSLEAIELKFKTFNRDFTRQLGQQISATKKLFKEAEKDAKTAGETIAEIFRGASTLQFEAELGGAGFGQQSQLLAAQLITAQAEAQRAFEQNDLSQFQKSATRVRELQNKKIEAEQELATARDRLDFEIEALRDRRSRARTRNERENATRQIRQLQRRRRLIERGSEADIEAAQKISDVLSTLSEANTAEAFQEVKNEITGIRKEQDLLNNSVGRERTSRQQAIDLVIEQAEQLAIIRKRNEEIALTGRIEEQRLSATKLALELNTSEAKAFADELGKVLQEGTIDEIRNAVQQQQRTFAEIGRLQDSLGGGSRARSLVEEQSIRIRQLGEQSILSLLEKQRSEAITRTQEEELAATNAAQAVRRLDLERLGVLKSQLDVIQQGLETRAGSRGGKQRVPRGAGGLLEELEFTVQPIAGAPRALEGVEVRFDELVFVLRQLLAEQVVDPTRARQDSIIELSNFISQIISQNEERARLALRAAPTVNDRANLFSLGSDINQAERDLVADLGTFIGVNRDLKNVLEDFTTRSLVLSTFTAEATEAAARAAERENLGGPLGFLLKFLSKTVTDFELAIGSISGAQTERESLRQQQFATPGGLSLPENVVVDVADNIGEGLIDVSKEAGEAFGRTAANTLNDAEPNLAAARLAQERLLQQEIRPSRERDPGRDTRRSQADGVSRSLFIGGSQSLETQRTKIFQELLERNAKLIEEGLAPITEIQIGAGAPDVELQQQIFARQQEEFIRAQERAPTEKLDLDERTANAVEAQLEAQNQTTEALTGLPDRFGGVLGAVLGGLLSPENINRLAQREETEQVIARSEQIPLPDTGELARVEKQLLDRAIASQQQSGRIQTAEQVLAEVLQERAAREAEVLQSGKTESFKALGQSQLRLAEAIDAEARTRERLTELLNAPVPQTFAEGGAVSGPGGRDNVPAMLSNGEFVVRNGPSQQFRNQLLAMNTGRLRPRGFAEGGEVTNMGGINVSVTESSSPQVTAREVANQINRGIRRGTIRIRGK